MTTRLDRLLLLLDTGSTPVIRRSAAQQLGEVQKLHPHELRNLLNRVHVHLRSNNWDTRIAAGEAIEAIASNVPKWEPGGLEIKSEKEVDENAVENSSNKDVLMFDKFDITHVLKHGEALLGSSGQEYDVFDEELLGLDVKERLAKQQDLLRRRLGLVPGLDSGMDNLLDDEDILPAHVVVQKSLKKQKSKDSQSTADLVAAEIAAISSSVGLSSREKNRAKRRAKILAKQRSKDNSSPVPGSSSKDEKEGPPEKKLKRTAQVVVDQPEDPDKILVDSVTDTTSWFEEEVEWPFTTFCQELCHELFHPSWEIRHGAATGLRHIIRIHGTGAGRTTDMPNDEMSAANELWLEDMSLKLLCVFALDRFGDFVTDEVVAPVRETCAQTLGVVVKHTKPSAVKSILNILLTLQAQQEWQVRHGGLLGIKYLLAVRKDMTDQLLPVVLAPLVGGLEDSDDDVRAVSAAAMLPVVEQIIVLMSDKIPAIVSILWDSLCLLDDLSASTSSIMMLLATIVSSSVIQSEQAITGKQGESLSSVVPRLWPFLRHNILSVRRAALQTLSTILATHKKNSDMEGGKQACWLLPILEDALRHLFERFLVEQVKELLMLLQKVWQSIISFVDSAKFAVVTTQWVNIWLSMAMYPKSATFNPAWIINTPVQHKDVSKKSVATEMIGGVVVGKSPSQVDSVILQARRESSRSLGYVGCSLSKAGDNQSLCALDIFVQCLHVALSSTSGAQFMVAAMIVSDWASLCKDCVHLSSLVPKLTSVLTAQIVYDEVGVLFTRLQTDCQSLQIAFQEKGINTSSTNPSGYHTIDSATLLVSSVFTEAVTKLPQKDVTHLQSKRRHLVATIGQLQYEFDKHNIRVLSVIAGALVTIGTLPPKLNPIIRPLMDAIKKEEDHSMHQLAACNLTKLLEFCLDRTPCPNSKIVKNLCLFACSDSNETPNIANSVKTPAPVTSSESTNGSGVQDGRYTGILTLIKQNESKASGSNSKKENAKASGLDDLSAVTDAEKDDENQKNVRLQRIGAELTLCNIAEHFKESLPEKVPELWSTMIGVLEKNLGEGVDLAVLKENDATAQELVNSLQLLELLAPTMDLTLLEKVLGIISQILRCLEHPYNSVRHMAARVLAVLATLSTTKVMEIVMDKVAPLLCATDSGVSRDGAIEAIFHITSCLYIHVVPYIVLLIIPTLGAMSDHCEHVRLMAAQCFATLISLMPLESSAKQPVQLSEALSKKRDTERHFLKQLFGETKLDNFTVPVPIKAELRKYQQDGVNWLAFLRKYKLHGILCDDMGLGKTLQTICIIAGDHHAKLAEYKKTNNPRLQPLPSLVICPPTLTGHWCYEVEKFIAKEHLNPLHYTGPPTERQRLRNKVKKHNLVIASYDIVRNDSDFFKSSLWNFCVLDEGHIIKNAKTKMSKVIKELRASHRLILSGTPIQNNVLELWSLFDFLMPGFLGSEKKFQAQYGKPILMSRDAKSSSKEQEEGALAMESLHRQVLPFLLRRMKEDVLQDLPPKIIQDYYCELSPLQLQLYEDFAKSKAKKEMENSLSVNNDDEKKEKRKGPPHVFQALQYLRKVCNHPSLVLTPSHPEYERIIGQLKEQNTSLHDINNASKLVALKQLLQDCGIGVSQSSDDISSDLIVSQHRVLLFCQFKSMLNIIEHDLLKVHMPAVTYLRLDGGTPAGQRYSIVQRFNDDPSIDVLLLTTHVGGLGLNLTGADTVIFLEHDWNPMKDSQAMDRAHRIGQKKVVNVYRLITRGTLEEKIMGLQKFKRNIANTVITQENSSFASMDTSQVLDLFSVQAGKKKDNPKPSSSANRTSMVEILENMGDLWDEKQYESEYDLGTFMNSLKS